MEQTLPAVQIPQVELPVQTKDLTPTQIGWIRLAELKTNYFKELSNGELVVQGFLNEIEKDEDLIKVQEKVKQAKAQIELDKQRRLVFTNYLTIKLIDPAMEFERRNFILLNTATKHELALRTKIVAKQHDEEKKENEKARLKAHIINEHERIASAYRNTILDLAVTGYENAIKGEFDKETLEKHIEAIKNFIRETKLPLFIKFTRVLVTDDEAKAIYNSIPVYDAMNDQQLGLKKVDDLFAMFEQDLKNKKKALAEIKAQQEQQKEREKENLEITIQTNTLVSQAGNLSVASGPQFKIKKLQKVIVENTEEWALAVLKGFIGNWNDCKKFVKVKTWDKLSIGQMADAISKLVSEGTQAQFPTLKFEEIKK